MGSNTDTLGQFEHMVLAAVYLLEDTGYNANITDKVCEMAGRKFYMGTVFVTLGRLEQRGLIASKLEEFPDRGRKARRIFTATPAGVAALKQWTEHAAQMIHILGRFS